MIFEIIFDFFSFRISLFSIFFPHFIGNILSHTPSYSTYSINRMPEFDEFYGSVWGFWDRSNGHYEGILLNLFEKKQKKIVNILLGVVFSPRDFRFE